MHWMHLQPKQSPCHQSCDCIAHTAVEGRLQVKICASGRAALADSDRYPAGSKQHFAVSKEA
jgi:hypothetical protein